MTIRVLICRWRRLRAGGSSVCLCLSARLVIIACVVRKVSVCAHFCLSFLSCFHDCLLPASISLHPSLLDFLYVCLLLHVRLCVVPVFVPSCFCVSVPLIPCLSRGPCRCFFVGPLYASAGLPCA